MSKTEKIMFSVVVCSFNGQDTIARALKSLINQDFPKDNYEILVIDDGSTDKTASIIATFPVTLLSMGRNQGLSAARNAGLKKAAGRIFVGFDDDCVAEPTWLSALASGYRQMQNIAGMGGQIIMKSSTPNIIAEYMLASNCGNPPSLTLDSSRAVSNRFLAYYHDRLFSAATTPASTQPREVRELNGANTSFPMEILRSVGGWDVQLSGVEDTDLCKRIANAYPTLHFYAVASAQLQHDPGLNLRKYLRRFYNRGAVNLAYYRRNKLVPPIFPFPVLVLFTAVAAIWLHSLILMLFVLCLPLALYVWWPIRAIREQNLQVLLYSYIQLLEESSSLLGLFRGYIVGVKQK